MANAFSQIVKGQLTGGAEQVRTEILTDEKGRLDDTGSVDTEYTMHDAKAAFDRMCRKYGW